LAESLTLQSHIATEYIATAWMQTRQRARDLDLSWISEITHIVICGCGDSHHAGLGMEMALAYWTGLEVRSVPSLSAARYVIPRWGSHAAGKLVIGISASGEVARTIEALEVAGAVGAHSLAITASPESTLADVAERTLSIDVPAIPHGPGLISYLASMLMLLGVADLLAPSAARKELSHTLEMLPATLDAWKAEQELMGARFAEQVEMDALVILGGGPAYASALFGAAKVIEAAGAYAWGQDLEEWAHLEYFCASARMPTWLLTTGGRSAGREAEVLAAAQRIGREIAVSRWEGGTDMSDIASEALSPLALWVGPAACAAELAARLDEKPFRDFGGGRSVEEGGGASRIRSSARIDPKKMGLLSHRNVKKN
jgi:glucosamine--fructose-6-phosphate aminotransferase (isomerizing)